MMSEAYSHEICVHTYIEIQRYERESKCGHVLTIDKSR